MTGKDICDHIEKSKILVKDDGTRPTSEEIWNSSPTGELYKVFEWYNIACAIIGEPLTTTQIR